MKSILCSILLGTLLAVVMVFSACSSSSGPETKVYIVNFNSAGATTAATPAIKTVTSPASTIDALPTDPEKTDHTFGGWWTLENGEGEAFTASTPVTGNITVHAYWTSNSFSITHNSPANTTFTVNDTSSLSAPVGSTVFAQTKSLSGYHLSTVPVYSVYNSANNLISGTPKNGGFEFTMCRVR